MAAHGRPGLHMAAHGYSRHNHSYPKRDHQPIANKHGAMAVHACPGLPLAPQDKLPMAALGYPYPGHPWLSMAAYPQAAHTYPWPPMTLHDYPWLSMATQGCPWLPMAVHGYTISIAAYP